VFCGELLCLSVQFSVLLESFFSADTAFSFLFTLFFSETAGHPRQYAEDQSFGFKYWASTFWAGELLNVCSSSELTIAFALGQMNILVV
jgi:hypothetical protein